nr:unnamed protein product [Digitaria exilis]
MGSSTAVVPGGELMARRDMPPSLLAGIRLPPLLWAGSAAAWRGAAIFWIGQIRRRPGGTRLLHDGIRPPHHRGLPGWIHSALHLASCWSAPTLFFLSLSLVRDRLLAPDTFVAAAARNPVCNLSLMVGTTDIPDWCFVEIYGREGKKYFSESPSVDDLCQFHQKSPISHISKVKTPTLFLLGAQDLRVPVSNGLQYARALKERGIESKTIVFPEDIHGIDKPQSDFESFLNIGVWFKKHMSK